MSKSPRTPVPSHWIPKEFGVLIQRDVPYNSERQCAECGTYFGAEEKVASSGSIASFSPSREPGGYHLLSILCPSRVCNVRTAVPVSDIFVENRRRDGDTRFFQEAAVLLAS